MFKVFAVANSTYFVTENKVYAAGNNLLNQLGLGDNDNRSVPTEIKFLTNKKITNIIGGQDYTFAISENGEVYAFGLNFNGQLGLGDRNNQVVPVENTILNNFHQKEIITGYMHNLLITEGKLYSWGCNKFGQLGLGDYDDKCIPTEVKFFSESGIRIKKAHAGYSHNFATTIDNKLYVWGTTRLGELGLGEDVEEVYCYPTELEFFRGKVIKDIQANSNTSFILTEDGKLYSFGYNGWGQLGLGHRNDMNTPQRVIIQNKVIDRILLGLDSILAITEDGAIYGWGWNNFLNSEDFNDESISFPIRLTDIEKLNPVEIKKGNSSMFIQLQNGDIYVMGANYFGELGLGHNNPVSNPTKLDLSFIQ